jgi:hypothetical protein
LAFIRSSKAATCSDRRSVSSRAIFLVNFDEDLAVGTKVFVCCNWITARGLTSPACAPIPLLIGGGKPDVMAG